MSQNADHKPITLEPRTLKLLLALLVGALGGGGGAYVFPQAQAAQRLQSMEAQMSTMNEKLTQLTVAVARLEERIPRGSRSPS